MESILTEEQINKLRADLQSVANHLPEHLLGEFWNYCNLIRGQRSPQPCTCKTSAGLWGGCVQTLRDYIKTVDG
jgi:hypothetical protein